MCPCVVSAFDSALTIIPLMEILMFRSASTANFERVPSGRIYSCGCCRRDSSVLNGLATAALNLKSALGKDDFT